MQSLPETRNPPIFLINVECDKTDLVLAVSVATSGTARHFVGLLIDLGGVGCGREDEFREGSQMPAYL